MRIFNAILILGLLLPSFGMVAQPVFSFTSHSAEEGEIVTVDVVVDDFEDMISVQFAMKWDASVLDFQALTNFNNGLGISEMSFNIPDSLGQEDIARFNQFWPEISGVSSPDGTVLFSIEFLVVGSECSSSEIIFDDDLISFPPLPFLIDIFQNDMDVTDETVFNSGLVDVPGEDCSEFSDLEFFGSQETAEPGEIVCVEIAVKGYNDIVSAQYSHSWDPELLEFVELRNFGLPSLGAANFNTAQSDMGRMGFSYSDPSGEPFSVSDNTVIYEICFEVLGNPGESALVEFADSPTSVDVVAEPEGVPTILDPIFSSGRVDFTGDFDGLNFNTQNAIGAPGDQVCVDVQVTGFDGVFGIQAQMEWDSDVLSFTELNRIGLPPDLSTGAGSVDEGVLLILWSSLGDEVSLDDNTVIFEICFEVIGDCEETTQVTLAPFDGDELIVIDEEGNRITHVSNPGFFTIECECRITPTVQDAICFGDSTGEIELDLSATCTPIENISWDGPTSIPDGTVNPENLAAGSYSVTLTYNGGSDETVVTDIIVGQPDEITIDNIDITFPDPPGSATGEIVVEASGGTGDLSYDWGPGLDNSAEITNLEADTYQLTITDENGCQLVSEPIELCGQIEISSEVNDVSCFGAGDGSILVDLADSENYSFEWSCTESESNSIDDLGPGICNLIITETESGCSAEFSFEINEPDSLEVEITEILEDEGTGNGEISVEVSGGTEPYTYNWSPGSFPDAPSITGLQGGEYSLTVVDANGCEIDLGPILVERSIVLGVQINDVACKGDSTGSITVNVSGGSGDFSFDWNCTGGESGDESSIGNLSAGTCTFTLIDNETGIEIIEEYEVNEPALELNFEVMSQECNENTNRADVTLLATGGVGPYQFSLNGVQFQSSNFFSDLTQGEETFFVRDNAGCVRGLEEEIESCIDEDCFESRLAITPNGDGLNDNLVIRCAENVQNVLRIFNRGGQIVYEENNYQNDWEGTTMGGGNLNEDTYMWVLEVINNSGSRDVYRGTVTLLRNLR